MTITLITGGAPHYEAGLIAALVERNIDLEVIGGPDLVNSETIHLPKVQFANLYQGASPCSSIWRKLKHVGVVYSMMMRHAVVSRSGLIHVQWPYKLPFFDRTLLNIFYKLLGKKLVFTAHNIDAAARDGKQSWANRLSLYFQYKIVDHIIVHTERMKSELMKEYGVNGSRITVIPHGIMSAVPMTGLDRPEARRRIGVGQSRRVVLFFGLITPYKGVELLVAALGRLCREDRDLTLVIAGRIKECQEYWDQVQQAIKDNHLEENVVTHLEHVPDEAVEAYFAAADVLVMPYRSIFQSGVLFLAYRFGLPVIATDVGSFREDIVEGKTGWVCKVDDPEDMAKTLSDYFRSDLFADLEASRQRIRDHAQARYAWSGIGEQTSKVYDRLLNP